MTVVSAMRFNEKEGAIVSDEQASYGYRKSDIATKIHELSNNRGSFVLVGGSGSYDIINDIILQTSDFIKEKANVVENGRDIVNMLAHVTTKVKRQYLNGYLVDLFGISESDFQVGQKPNSDGKLSAIDRSIVEKYYQIISSNDERSAWLTNNNLIALSHDKNIVQLYSVSMFLANPVPIVRPYHIIGIGSDMADGELSNFFENIPRGKREDVDPIDALSALLYATERASARNISVGGTPHICVVKEGVKFMPNENNSRLAAEVVKASRKGYLPKEFERQALESLIYKGGDFKNIEKQMWKEVKNKNRFSLMLRGYKV